MNIVLHNHLNLDYTLILTLINVIIPGRLKLSGLITIHFLLVYDYITADLILISLRNPLIY